MKYGVECIDCGYTWESDFNNLQERCWECDSGNIKLLKKIRRPYRKLVKLTAKIIEEIRNEIKKVEVLKAPAPRESLEGNMIWSKKRRKEIDKIVRRVCKKREIDENRIRIIGGWIW